MLRWKQRLDAQEIRLKTPEEKAGRGGGRKDCSGRDVGEVTIAVTSNLTGGGAMPTLTVGMTSVPRTLKYAPG